MAGSGRRRGIVGIILALGAAIAASPARADVAEFYTGKTLTIVIGYPPGGGYDVFARVLGRHLSRHIPGNPGIVMQNMPGAGSRRAGMYLYGVAPKDGTVIGTIGRNEAIAPLVDETAKFDGSRFAWIGSIADDNSVCIAWHTAPVKSWQELQTREMTVGAQAAGDNTVTVPLLLRNLFGARLKVVKGYPSTGEQFLALERGEVQGACGVSWRVVTFQRRDWIAEKKINVLLQVALNRDPTLGDTPLITQFVRDKEQLDTLSLLIATQAMARPFLAPPGIPEDRKQALRQAFDATMKDPQFLAEIEKSGLYVSPMAGAAIERMINALYATPQSLRARAVEAIRE